MFSLPHWIIELLVAVALWDILWKGFALWRAARNNQHAWFVLLFLLETAGLLPIIYLLLYPVKDKVESKL
jgi:hypothetical protein